ncbi:MAG: hypothetical protein NTNFB02_19270 [Nitrospira sp.]
MKREMSDDLLQLCPLLRLYGSELNTKRLSFHPPNLCFIDAKGPIQTWHMDSAFERRTEDDHLFAFDSATSAGKVQRLSLSFTLPAGEGTSKLRSEPWVCSLVDRLTFFN